MQILIQIAMKLLLALATEKVVKETLIAAGRRGAKLTDTDLDDEIVEIVAKAWGDSK